MTKFIIGIKYYEKSVWQGRNGPVYNKLDAVVYESDERFSQIQLQASLVFYKMNIDYAENAWHILEEIK